MRAEVSVSILDAITSEKRKESAFQQPSTAQILEFCLFCEQHCDRTHIKLFKVSLFSSQVSAHYITTSGKYLLTSFWLHKNQDFRAECENKKLKCLVLPLVKD